MAAVLCLGACVFDTILRVPAIPPAPAKVLASACVQIGSGMSSSAAAAVARLGGRAELWGRVGDDMAGRQFLADLAGAGVDVSQMRVVPGGRTPVSTIVIDESGQRLIVPYYDPTLDRDPSWLPVERIARFGAVATDPRWPEGAARLLDDARRAGIPALFDADTAPRAVLDDLIGRASHVVFSEPALIDLAGTGDIAAALHAVAARIDGLVGVTAGERGFFWREGAHIRHVPAPTVAAVDTLAAGDVFHGAFALALAEGRTVADAGRFANIAASLKCRSFGGRLGTPDRAEVDAFLAASNHV